MKNLIKFLEENSKWLVVLFIIVGLGLIVKLWSIGLQIRGSGSGGYIDLSIGWTFDYYRINAGYIAVLLFIISILLILKIKSLKNKYKLQKVFIAFIILFLGLISKQLFFLSSPEFKFYLTPVTNQYKDSEGNITDIDNYLESIGKYCVDDRFNSLNYMYGQETMCSINNKFQTFFNNEEEYIKVFDYANKISHKLLYDRTYGGANKFGIEKILKKYDDATFQAYVIEKTSDINYLKNIKKITTNNKIINVLDYYIEMINYYENNEFTQDEGYLYWNKLSKEIEKRLKEVIGVNVKLF